MEATHYRRGCHQSGRSTWNHTSTRQNQSRGNIWAKRAGKDPTGAQARAHYLHNLTRESQTGGTEEAQNDLQREEERSHGQAPEGGEQGNNRQNSGNKACSPTVGTASPEMIKNNRDGCRQSRNGRHEIHCKKSPAFKLPTRRGLGRSENSQRARRRSSKSGNVAKPPNTAETESGHPL